MKTPRPFEPHWSASVGPIRRQGKGLLSGDLRFHRDLLDSLEVRTSSAAVTVKPRTGEMFVGTQKIAMLGPSRLLWYRTMEEQIGTHDKNHDAPQCLWYGIGLENERGRFGCRILSDGSVKAGLE